MNKEEVEKKAFQRFGAMKIIEGVYAISDISITTGSDEAIFFKNNIGESSEYLSKEIVKEIDNVAGSESNMILLSIDKELDNGFVNIGVCNPVEDKKIVLKMESAADKKRRYLITGMVANSICRKGVEVAFYLYYSYERLEEMVLNNA